MGAFPRMPATKIESVQALRAVAALCIAILHVLNDATTLDPGGLMAHWHEGLPWAGGVDLFFVISGFVMVYASGALFGNRNSPALFMARRLIRIVPLYWTTTTLFLLVALTARSSVSEGAGSVADVVMSYAFLPARRADGGIQPIYSLGWTLNYEMFFYVVFAACIWQTRRRALVLVALLLGAAMAMHPLVPEQATALVFWTDPILAEFLFGMAVAVAAAAGVSLSAPIRAGVIVAALLLLMIGHIYTGDGSRPLTIGVPMAMLMAGTVLGRPVRIGRALLLLGDASYALYLVHPFAMRPVALLWRHLHLTGPVAAAGYAVVALTLAVAGAICVQLWFDRPIGDWLRARLAEFAVRRALLPRALAS